MAIDKTRYPANWNEISASIRERAGNKCEGCGLPNGVEIVRSDIDGARYIVWDDDMGGYRSPTGSLIRLSEIPTEYDISKRHTRIVLTVHHAGVDYPDGTPGDPADKMDNRPENLFALCQRCHLLADLDHNVKARRVTRLVKQHDQIVASGQYELFGGKASD